MSQVQLQFRLNGKDYSIQADPTQRSHRHHAYRGRAPF